MLVSDSVLVGGLPWASGALLALSFASGARMSVGERIVLVGVGGYFGYIVLALKIWALEHFFVTASSEGDVYILGILCLLSGFLLAVKRQKIVEDNFRCDMRGQSALYLLPLGLSALNLLFAFWLVHLQASNSWDALNFWHKEAARLAAYLESDASASFDYNMRRHPLTVSLVSGWVAHQTHSLVGHSNGNWPWPFLLLSMFLMVFGMAMKASKSLNYASWTGLAFISVPLLANHGLQPGYSELFVATGLLAATSLAMLAVWNDISWGFLLLSIAAAMSLIFLKNIGIFYTVIFLLALGPACLWQKHKLSLLAIVLLLGAVGYFVWAESLNFILLGNRTGVTGAEEKVLRFAGRRLHLNFDHSTAIPAILMRSFLENASFSVLATLAIIMSYAGLSHRATRIPLFLVLLGVTFLAFSQLTEYGQAHAVIDADTGGSRFQMPIIIISALLLCFMGHRRKRNFNLSSTELAGR